MVMTSDTPRVDDMETLAENFHGMVMVVNAVFARQLEVELNDSEYMGNLLAIVHRDGGHYHAKHATRKATDDAIEIVSKLKQSRDDYRECCESLANGINELLHHGASIPHPVTGEQIQYQSNPEVAEQALKEFEQLKQKVKSREREASQKSQHAPEVF